MHYTHCIKQGPPYIYSHYNWIRFIHYTRQYIIIRLDEDNKNKQENVVRIREREGKKQKEREQGREHYVPESEYFLMQLSAALVSEDENLVSHCWGTQWTSITLPCECCWGMSLDLPCASSPRMTTAVAAEVFLSSDADVNACKGTSSLSAFPLHSHTVTAEMKQEATRNRTNAAVSTGS